MGVAEVGWGDGEGVGGRDSHILIIWLENFANVPLTKKKREFLDYQFQKKFHYLGELTLFK
jgi:hypothetical protein